MDEIIEPFVRVAQTHRRLWWCLMLSILSNVVLGILVFSSGRSALVFELYPNGETVFVADRYARVLPRPYEAEAIARRWVEGFYGYTSPTVYDDFAEIFSLCAPKLASEMHTELKNNGVYEAIRQQNNQVRGEVEFEEITILEESRRMYVVRVKGLSKKYPLFRLDGDPLYVTPIEVDVFLSVVPRSEHRPNGLEVASVSVFGAGRFNGAVARPSTEVN